MDNPQHSLDAVAITARLNALADRCEAAAGPDRELDIDICTRGLNKSRSDPGFQSAPFYTASLDAAMTLVPEGFDWIIGRTNGGLTTHAEVGGRGDEFMRFGATPALALCAAALRARAGGSNDTQP